MEQKEDRRITMTKRMLKNALTDMLKEKDIYHISIRELCERADVNRTTFYKHYGSQFELLDDMETDLLDRTAKMITEDTDNSGSSVEKILAFFEKDIEFVRLLINSNVDPEFPQKIFSMTVIKNSLKKRKPKTLKNENEYINRFVLFGAYELVKSWLNKEERESPKEMAEIIVRLFVLNFSE